ncbi:MAG: VCBS repeat-containing protein, partial [Myxococcales bacterium]|nr:VCBS repeat-containing protein [Myxococcales bacterium]
MRTVRRVMNAYVRSLPAFLIAIATMLSGAAATARAQQLDERCVATVLNRTAQVNPDGTFAVGNVPVPPAGGAFRVRLVCETDEGVLRAQSAFIPGVPNGDTPIGAITFGAESAPIPVTLTVTSPATLLTEAAPGAQLVTTGTLADGTPIDLTLADTGTVYLSSNPAIAPVTTNGFVTAQTSGTVIVTATHEGVIATIQIDVVLDDDTDGDQIPDDFEQANAVGPGGTNLARGPSVAVGASSSNGFVPARAIDGDVRTSWFSADDDSVTQGGAPFIEVTLAQAADLSQVRVLGNRESRDGFDALTGTITAFDAGDAQVFTSGVQALPAPNRDLAVAIGMAGIRRVRFTPATDEGTRVGVSELQLIAQGGGAGFNAANPADAALDFDFDGVTNLDEFNDGTNPFSDDTDVDGIPDGAEAALGTDPLRSDSDNDGLTDGDEHDPGGDADSDGTINALDFDSDADGLPDGVEVALGLDPLDADTDNDALPDGNEDTDGDGIPNLEEIAENTDPGNPDTDGDGISDGQELLDGTDPLTPEGIAPVVTFLRPQSGATVIEGQRIEVRFTATDNVAVSVARLRENGALVAVDKTPTYYRSIRTVPLGIPSVVYEVTAFDTNGNATVRAITLNVVEDVGTTVAGRVVDAGMSPVEGATARLRRDTALSAVTDANGDFSISGVSNLLGPVGVIARGAVDGQTVQGGSPLTDQEVGGTTDVGTLVLRPQPPYPGEIFPAGDDREGTQMTAAGDFNGDGIPDLAITNRGRFGQDPTDGHISILIGLGDGTFAPEVRYPAGTRPQAVAVADFNEDGDPDLVVANQQSPATVHLGNGDGTFGAGAEVGNGVPSDQFTWVAVGDVNDDDNLDFVIVGNTSTHKVLLGDGDGTFQAERTTAAGVAGNQIVVLRDMDGDGFDDIVT